MVFAIVVALAASPAATTLVNGDELPELLRAPGETALLTAHAEGAQIYECQWDAAGKLVWRLREPIATLFQEGKTIGRHYAGPQWELNDGSRVQGNLEAKAPGATTSDIPWLKLVVVAHMGRGALEEATTIQRIDTHGGVLEGECEAAGAFRSVAYAADYVFLRK
jgi:hypothetical protein